MPPQSREDVEDTEAEAVNVEAELIDVEAEPVDVEAEIVDVEAKIVDVEAELVDADVGVARFCWLCKMELWKCLRKYSNMRWWQELDRV